MNIREKLRSWVAEDPEIIEERVRRLRLERLGVEQDLAVQRLATDMARTIWESEKGKERWDLPSASEIRAAAKNPTLRLRLKERYADVELYQDDIGWERMGASYAALDLPDGVRTSYVTRSRQYFMSNYPVMTRTITLFTWYAFGRNVEFSSDDEGVQKDIDAFMGDDANRALLDDDGQERMSDRRQVDGELFPVYFLGDGIPKIRLIDCLQITEIKCKEDDPLTPLWYKREWNDGKKNSTKWYADYRSDPRDLQKNKPDVSKGGSIEDPKKVTVGHWRLSGLGQRGLGRAFPCLEWLHELKRFMERRITISIAASMIAWVTKFEGTHAQGDVLKDDWGDASGDDPRIPPVAGTRLLENDKATTSWMRTDTNAAGAKTDEEMFMRRIACGLGINPVILGWDIARWATALAMNDPLIVSFTNYQQHWASDFEYMLKYVLEQMGHEPGTYTIDVDFPPIKVTDKKNEVDSLLVGQQIVGSQPELNKEVIRQTLVALGTNNVQELMDKMAEPTEEPEEEEGVGQLLASLQRHRALLESELFGGNDGRRN